ncbi:MAG: hypothetical protein OEQ53_18675 [Saprospiraceae bacterium]|nr:hypothetical protein [Saprospiraceae bacterium]
MNIVFTSRHPILWFCLLVVSSSIQCEKEPDLVDPELRQYLVAFQEEAASRGIKVDYVKKPIEARIELHENDVQLGWCNYDFDTQNMITINNLFWPILDDFDKEKLVFHELGHCVLFRSHLDVKTDDGFCKSIMHSGQSCADNYSSETRKQYLDELFLR